MGCSNIIRVIGKRMYISNLGRILHTARLKLTKLLRSLQALFYFFQIQNSRSSSEHHLGLSISIFLVIHAISMLIMDRDVS